MATTVPGRSDSHDRGRMRTQFLEGIAKIRIWKQSGRRAPHKPLLLLLALGRVYAGAPRLGLYGEEFEGSLRELLGRFGPPRKAHHPDQPFTRLPGDGLWEIPGIERAPTTRSGRPKRAALRGLAGGFPELLHDLLAADTVLVIEAAQELLDGHFPRSMHAGIRDAVGLPEYEYLNLTARPSLVRDAPGPFPSTQRPSPTRDPGFRHKVLRAYYRRCAVCGFDVRVEDQLLGLEAAHIKWHAAGGPDCVPNGLALCSLHHKALDAGAIGLKRRDDEVRLLVSCEVNGRSAAVAQLLDCRDRPLRPAQSTSLSPNPEFVRWHRREVFRGPAL